jgi:hypothetical protein
VRTESILTTIDNPFNPFNDLDEWLVWDRQKGYHTPSLLARVLMTSDDLSENDQEVLLEEAIDEIVKHNVSGVHTKITRSVE